MMQLPFDVNDEALRKDLLHRNVFVCLERLSGTTKARWGTMTAQQMLEHLVWTLEVSNGLFEVQCRLHPKLVAKTKGFLLDNTPTSHEFMNPVLKKGLPPGRFSTLADAIRELRRQADLFAREPGGERDVLRTHPVFGQLNHEEWERSHYKHFYHHLLQFGLIADVRENERLLHRKPCDGT